MADSIVSAAGTATVQTAPAISAMRSGRAVDKAVMNRLISSIEQAGKTALQSAPNGVDRVQISQEGQRRLAAEQAG